MGKINISQLVKSKGYWKKGDTVSPKLFKEFKLNTDQEGYIDTEKESIPPNVLGYTVDLGARFFILHDKNTFIRARMGANNKNIIDLMQRKRLIEQEERLTRSHDEYYDEAPLLGDEIFECCAKVLSNAADKPIYKITKEEYNALTGMAYLECMYRSSAAINRPMAELNSVTFHHLKIFMKRSKNFFKVYGRPSTIGFDIDDKMVFGDGDYLSDSYVADFKLYSNPLLNNVRNRRQILLYYVLGKKENKFPEFQTVEKLIFFNPRTDMAYELAISDIPQDIIDKTLEIAEKGI